MSVDTMYDRSTYYAISTYRPSVPRSQPYLSAPSVDGFSPSPMKQLKSQPGSQPVASPHASPSSNELRPNNSKSSVMVPQQTVISHINELMDDAMPEQTVVKVLDNVSLETFSQVEKVLESSHFRVDYNAEKELLIVTIPSATHECGVRAIRRLFESAMEYYVTRYQAAWKYDTGVTFPMFRIGPDGEEVPAGYSCTPDGAVSDGKLGLMLPVEIATSQDVEEAREKIKKYFSNRSVIAGIILNIDETPDYASPKSRNAWDWNQKMLTRGEWAELKFQPWAPRSYGNHCWSGNIACEIEIYWPPHEGVHVSFQASLVPVGDQINIDAINIELEAIWRHLLRVHFRNLPSVPSVRPSEAPIPKLDVAQFHHALADDLDTTAFHRYVNAWASANGGKKRASTANSTATPFHPTNVLREDIVREAQARQQSLKRRLQERDEGDEEKGGRLPSKVQRLENLVLDKV